MFDKKDIDAVLETYKGIDPKELADCAEQIAGKLGDDAKVTHKQILQKAATRIMAAKRKQARENGVQKEQEQQAEEEQAIEDETSVAVVDEGDYVPPAEVTATDYITAAITIDPKRDFYKGPNGQTLAKTGLDKLARAAQISTEVVDVQVTSDMILAKVRGWIGPKSDPVMETEDISDYSIRDKSEEFILDKVNKKQVKPEDVQMDESGRLWFVNPVHNLKMRSFLIKEREFALRATVSRAENRVKRKLLGLNSMDLKEAEMLRKEFEKVQRRLK